MNNTALGSKTELILKELKLQWEANLCTMTVQEDYATTVIEGGFNAEAKEAGLGRIRKEVQLTLSES